MNPRWNDGGGYPGCPCKGCAERHLRCHADCEPYANWRVTVDETRERIQLEESLNRDFWGTVKSVSGKRKCIERKYSTERKKR